MRLHNEEVIRRENLIREFFKTNPHSGIRQAQEFLAAKSEKSMNHRAVYRIRDEIRKSLFRDPNPAPTRPLTGERQTKALAPPILSTVRSLATLMAAHKVESLTVSFNKGKPVLRYAKLASVEGTVDILAPPAKKPDKPATPMQ